MKTIQAENRNDSNLLGSFDGDLSGINSKE
jgi:hypothetical protein